MEGALPSNAIVRVQTSGLKFVDMEGNSMTGFPEIPDPQAAKFSPDGYQLAVQTTQGISILAM